MSARGILNEIKYFIDESTVKGNEKRYLQLIAEFSWRNRPLPKKDVSDKMAAFLRHGLDVHNSVQALHSLYKPDQVNKMLDYYAETYQTSPFEYQDNLNITRNDLVKNLENLYTTVEGMEELV